MGPLAEIMLEAGDEAAVEAEAERFLNEEKGVESKEMALAGAKDILAEEMADDAEIRKWVREHTWASGEAGHSSP